MRRDQSVLGCAAPVRAFFYFHSYSEHIPTSGDFSHVYGYDLEIADHRHFLG